jgi:ferredoxin
VTPPPAITVHIDPQLCEGHSICTKLSPDPFELNDEDIASVTDENPGEEHWAALHTAAAACPRQAITVARPGR